ncbi:hypothetical protein Ndes2526B_g08431 [Nannochloris sp. 'desiccata']
MTLRQKLSSDSWCKNNMVRGASSRLGHLTKRAGARATVSSAQTDPLSRAAFKFMADTAKANSFQHYLQMLVFYRDMGNGMEHHLKPAGVVADWKSGGINKGAGERRCRTPAAWPGLSAHIPRACI